MNTIKLCLTSLLLLTGIGAAQAFDFLYVEDSYEVAELTSIEPLDSNGLGNLTVEVEECPHCATEFVYSRETMLETAAGGRRPIQELRNWTGYSARIVWSLPDEKVVYISIFPAQN